MFFQCPDVDAKILSVIQMGWQRVSARAGARPFHTLSFRLEGDATFSSESGELLTVQENEIVFVPAQYDFSKQAGKGQILAIHFTASNQLPEEILRFSPENPGYFRSAFLQLHQIWTGKKPGYEYEAKIYLYRIILEMEREWAKDKRSAASRQLKPALDFINAHYAEGSVSVEAISRLCGMSDTYLRKLFVAEYGKTPQQYISNLRLTKATELLQSGYYSVSEIASRCGFNNINYFSTFIKKETGLSPLQYRNKLLHTQKSGNLY